MLERKGFFCLEIEGKLTRLSDYVEPSIVFDLAKFDCN